MGKIIISANASLDGVAQDPTGEEGFRSGGWFGQITDKDRQAWAELGAQEALDASARFLATELKRTGKVELAVASYNAGPGNVNGAIPKNGETEFYVAKVMRAYRR